MGRQFIRYCLVGIVNTMIGFSCIAFALSVLHLGNVAANLLAYVMAAAVSYQLNRHFTFRHTGAIGRSSRRFIAVMLGAYGCNLAMVILVHDGLGAGSYTAQISGMVTYTAVSFLGSRIFAFAPA